MREEAAAGTGWDGTPPLPLPFLSGGEEIRRLEQFGEGGLHSREGERQRCSLLENLCPAGTIGALSC